MVGSVAKMVTVLLLLLGAVALMTGCAADETPAPGVTPLTDSDGGASEGIPGLTEGPTAEAPATEAPTAEVEVTSQGEEPQETAEPTAEPSPTPIVVVDVDSACVDCHTDQERLAELAEGPEEVHLSSGEGWGGAVPPLEAWEKVLISADALQDLWGTGEAYSVHGRLSCVECHGGRNADEKEDAHQGLMPDPSDIENSICAECHYEHACYDPNNRHVFGIERLGRWDKLIERNSNHNPGDASENPA